MLFLKPGFVQIAFGGEDAGGGGGGGSEPPRTRPQQRPSIMTVQRTPEDERQRVATRDMPRFGISAGDTTSEPDYSPFSLRGLTSTDPGNVMRNIQASEMYARQAAEQERGGRDDNDRPEPEAPAPATPAPTPEAPPAPPPPPPPPVQTESGMTPEQEKRIETAGEEAAEKQRKLGLAQTIATSPRGLLAGGQGTTRRRRSLIGGGLIV